MTIEFYVKSGTGGYSDEGGCDASVLTIKNDKFPIPRVGESVEILEDNDKGRTNPSGTVFQEYHQYMVTDVRYWVSGERFGVNIYVVPIGRGLRGF